MQPRGRKVTHIIVVAICTLNVLNNVSKVIDDLRVSLVFRCGI